MTELDKTTGLPILGSGKSVPIDLKLMPDLRAADKAVSEIRAAGQMIGYQLVMLTGTASVVGQQASTREKEYRDIVGKVVAMHGLSIDAVKDIDLDKGVIVLK